MSATENSRQEDAAARFEIEAVPHLPVLKRLALHLVRNRAEAEDLVQGPFAQALTDVPSFTVITFADFATSQNRLR